MENTDKSMKKSATKAVSARRKKTESLTKGDEQAMLAKEAEAHPKADLGTTFKTFEHHLPAKLRAIAISSEALRANGSLDKDRMWPVVEIFDLPDDGDLRAATSFGIEGPDGTVAHVFRHVEILGPCRVAHNPEMPLQHNGRRVAVMVTEAPLRVHVDTPEQMNLNGTRASSTKDDGSSGGSSGGSSYGRSRPFGC